MKNNEFNKVKINNEGASASYEFLGLPKEEVASVAETAKPYKDELNSRKVNNDIIEANTLNKDRKAGGLKKDYKQMKHGPLHLASTAGHAVVAATTVSIAVVATAVGMTLLVEQEEQDIAIFTNSTITIDSIEFSVVFPASLIEYEQSPEGGPSIETYTEIVAVVANDNYNSDFKDRQMIEEYGPYDPDPDNYYEGWSMWNGLTPDTEYGLYIFADTKVWTEEQQEEIVSSQRIASTTFRTRQIINSITFSDFVVDSTYVSFGFEVDLSLLEGVSPGDQVSPEQANLFAEISNSEYFDSLYLSDFQWNRPLTVLTCYGEFTGLTPSTSYTLTIYQTRETEYAALARKTFTTRAASHGFNGISFVEDTSFYSHSFDVLLDYFDNDNCYSDFELTMINGQGITLGVHDLGDAPPYQQTVNIEQVENQTSQDPTWEYNLDDVENYQLTYFDSYLGETQFVTGQVTFTDTDISNFLGFGNQSFDYNSTEGLTYVPFSLSFVDEGHKWSYFTVAVEYEYQDMTQGGTQTVTFESATLDPIANRYQYATFYEDVESNKSISDFGGDEGTAYVYANGNNASTDDAIYTTSITFERSYDWEFYYLGFDSLDVSDGHDDLTLNLVYTMFEDEECNLQVYFEDVNTGEIFIYNIASNLTYITGQLTFNLEAYYDTENVDPNAGYQWAPYANLKETYEGRYFNIYLSYYTQSPGSSDPSDTTTVMIVENAQINFA